MRRTASAKSSSGYPGVQGQDYGTVTFDPFDDSKEPHDIPVVAATGRLKELADEGLLTNYEDFVVRFLNMGVPKTFTWVGETPPAPPGSGLQELRARARAARRRADSGLSEEPAGD